jgi:hypothetical protein
MHGFSSISFYYLFLDMVFTYDDAQRPNSHKEKLFSLLVFFLANYKVGVTMTNIKPNTLLAPIWGQKLMVYCCSLR